MGTLLLWAREDDDDHDERETEVRKGECEATKGQQRELHRVEVKRPANLVPTPMMAAEICCARRGEGASVKDARGSLRLPVGMLLPCFFQPGRRG